MKALKKIVYIIILLMKRKINLYKENINKWEIIFPLIIIFISFYIITMPFSPFVETEIFVKQQKPFKESFTKIPEKELIIIYKVINNPMDITDIDCKAVLPIVYKNIVSLKDLPVKERKKKFIALILPSILIANYEIQKVREKLKKIQEKLDNNEELTYKEKEFLESLLEKYKAESIPELLEKINTHKPSLIIAQAAIESGWGTSRFAVKANNLFGTWTFNKKYAYKIKAKKSNVYLKRYNSVLDAIRDYYYNVSVSWAYEKFRKVRLKTKDSLKLANYLDKYSILREKYVKRIKTVIKHNNLQQYDNCKLKFTYTGTK